MKKLVSLILVCAMAMSFAVSVPVFAAEAASGTFGTNLTWSLDDDGTLTVAGTGEMQSTAWRNYPWYSYIDSINKVVIGEGVTSIGEDAFWNYDSITEVELSSTLTTIGGFAFSGCDSLTEMTIPAGVETIGMMALYGIVTIKGYKYSPAWAYAKVEEIGFVSLGEVPEKVLSEDKCGDEAVYSLTNRGILTVSGKGELYGYDYEESPWWSYVNFIHSIIIEDGITAIGDGTFNALIHVEEIDISDSVTSVGEMAFYGCYKVEELTLPSGLVTISAEAFNSLGIKELVIPEGVTYIGDLAFSGSPLEKVIVPESVAYIGEEAFGDGYTICVIEGVKGSYAETWANENGYSFTGHHAEPVTGTLGSLAWVLDTDGTFTVSGTGAMDYYSFHGSYSWYEYEEEMKNIIIEVGITRISDRAFYSCSNLESVTIPYTVTNIGSYAFYAAPESLVIKGYEGSVAETYASNNNYEFQSLGEAPLYDVASGSCGTGVTWKLDSHGLLTISGEGEIEDYSGWTADKSVIRELVIEEGVSAICYYAFNGCSYIEKVTLPETLTTIGGYAFSGCDSLTEITIPLAVSSIGYGAFDGLSVTIKGYSPSAAEDFANEYYYDFVSLGAAPRMTIGSGSCGEGLTWSLDNYGLLKIEGEGIMEIDGSAPWYSFRTQLKKVEVCEGVTTICDSAFEWCTYIEEVVLPESLTAIGSSAFAYCYELKEVTIHYNVTNISEFAFSGVSDLTVKGYTGSAAEEIANDNYYTFVSLGEAPLVTLAEGNVTDTITWSFNNRGVLRVEGTGEMPEYTYDGPRPWDEYSYRIKSVEIEGVDRVYGYSFMWGDNLTSVTVKDVKYLDSYAFDYCNYIEEATIYPSVGAIGRNAFYYNASKMTIKGVEGTYAQMYADYVGSVFEAMEGSTEIKTVYASTVEELVAAIGSNTTIILEDGIYLLDKTSYLGNASYSWEYADMLKFENVINLTIKARNPGMVEILAPQNEKLSNYSYENALLYIKGAYNLVVDGIRMGNMTMSDYNYRVPSSDGAELMGGYDEYALDGYYGAYVTSADYSDYVPVANRVKLVDCDIFNCAYAVAFYGDSLTMEGCTVRDNIKGAVNVTSGEAVINNCVFYRNGNSTAYRGNYCLNMSGTVTNSVFVNNGNESYCSGELSGDGNVFSDNGWNGESMKAYGITKNGITWSVSDDNGENVLKIGYTVEGTSASFESKSGEIYPYSVTSLPWKEYDIDSVMVNDNVSYNPLILGSCGRNVTWTYDGDTKTLSLSGKGDMTDVGYIAEWGKYDVENIVIGDRVTGVYDLFEYTDYFRDENNYENGLLYIGDVLVWAKSDLTGEVTVKEGTRVIADEAFIYCTGITALVLPETVEHIGVTEKLNVGSMGDNGVFEDCTNLTSITIPVSVTEFDHAMFYNCNMLKDIYYSGTMAQWQAIDKAKRNDQLDYCTIHAADGTIEPPVYSYEIVGEEAMITSVSPVAEKVVIPREIDGVPVTYIDSKAFVGNSTLKTVVIEAALEEAVYFTSCKSLERVEFAGGVKYCYDEIFEGCESLATIILGDEIVEMDANMFEDTAYYRNAANWDGGILYVDGYATALASDAAGKITVRSDAKAVCYNTFNNNNAVTEVVIPDGVAMQEIGESFYNMSALVSITLPDTFAAPEYGFGIFDCEKLTSITISENNESLASVDGVVFTKDMTELVYMPMGRSGSYTVPEGVTTLGGYSFSDTHLSKLTIPGGVNYIADYAFLYSYYLTDIYYNITTAEWSEADGIYIGYGNDAFDNASLHLLDSDFGAETISYALSDDGTYYIVSSVADYAEVVEIPDKYNNLPVKEIYSWTLYMKKRVSEIKVDENNEYLTSVDGVLFTKDMSTLIAYPAGSEKESYSVPVGVEAIGENAFACSGNLKSIDLGSVTAIGSWAFEASGIKSVSVPGGVTELTYGVFNTSELESVSFGKNVRSVTASTFSDDLKYIYFDGTPDEWRSVSGWYNVSSDINVVTKVEVNAFVFREEEEAIRLELSVQGIEESVEQGNAPSIFILGLDNNDNNVTVDSVGMEQYYSGNVKIEGEDEVLDQVKTVKVFVWESLESMKPISDPVIFEVYNFE